MKRQDALNSIVDWIKAQAKPKFGNVEVSPETRLLELQLLDSLQIMDLVFFLEETSGQKIALEKLIGENFETPNAIAALICRAD